MSKLTIRSTQYKIVRSVHYKTTSMRDKRFAKWVILLTGGFENRATRLVMVLNYNAATNGMDGV